MPLLLPCALALWATAAVAFTGGRELDVSLLVGVALAGAVGGVAGIAMLLIQRRAATTCAIVASALLGVALGAFGAASMQSDAQWAIAESRTYAFELLEDGSAGSFGMSAKARATDEQGRSVVVRASFDEDERALCGWRFASRCQMELPQEQSADYFWGQGMVARASVESVESLGSEGPIGALRGLRAKAIALLGEYGGSQGPLLQALACGYRQSIKESGSYDRFKVAGLAHIVAVSGAHLAIVVAVAGWVLRRARVPYVVSFALLLAFTAGYLVLAGIPISAVRAAAMVTLSMTGRSVGRQASALGALGLCIIGFIACDPAAAVSVSLFLSAGSTLGIVLFSSLIASWLGGRSDHWRRWVAEPLGLTLGSNLVTQLPAAALFSQLPLVAPLSNMVAGPLFSLACVAGLMAALASCALPVLAPALVGAAAWAAWPLESACTVLAGLPFASVAVALPVAPMVVLSAAGCLALWLAWPRLGLRALVGGCAALFAGGFVAIAIAPALHGNAITMLDVGQGDAFLVRSGRAAVLVDTGNQDSMLREALGREGVYGLDAVLITHPDDDHCASLDALAEVVQVGAVYAPADALDCPCEHCAGLRESALQAAPGGLQGLEVGDRMAIGAFELEVLWPHGFEDEGGNGDSLCVLASLDADGDGERDWRALFCGDAEAEQLQAIIDETSIAPVDIFKVGHHGSRAGLTDEVAQALRPRIALVSAGAHNRYGHPTQETLDRLDAVGASILRTDQQGTVTLQLDADAAAVHVERE